MSERRRISPTVRPDQMGLADKIKPPAPDALVRSDRWVAVEFLTLIIVVAVALAWIGGAYVYRPVTNKPQPIGDTATKEIVERIITIESNGSPNMKNRRSSATGAGQFLNDT
jgi:hypothetical protein